MAYVDDLIANVEDSKLRTALATELARIKRRASFGLVFERHIPETGVLPGLRPRKGSVVVLREDPERTYVVESVNAAKAQLRELKGEASCQARLTDLLVVAELGNPIYPALTSVGVVERSTGRPFHAVINAENYHALQLFTYTFAGQVDCIYIDPPYNTGARNWTYNNRFVDSTDLYRHSKWLAMMERRLRLARKLLKPNAVLIVTIDEHEVHHLGVLLEQLFPEAYVQIVTIVINPKGVAQPRFYRVDEYAFFCFFGSAAVNGYWDDLLTPGIDDAEEDIQEMAEAREPRWGALLRSGTDARRADRKDMFYPVLIDPDRRAVVGVGEPLPFEKTPDLTVLVDGFRAAWPVRKDGSFGRWAIGHKTLGRLIEQGYVAVGDYDKKRKTWALRYLSRQTRQQIRSGILKIVSIDKDRNVVDVRFTGISTRRIKTVWHRSRHDAGVGGTDLLRAMLGGRPFPFAKSVYAVKDTLGAVVGANPNALIVDFFAGSGTTLHATCLLNKEDGGNRRCILVTNNEVDPDTQTKLTQQGTYRGDPEYERHGVFEAVAKPRCEAAITGKRSDGRLVEGEYLNGTPYSEGFEANVEFFRIDYLDKDCVELGRAFNAINPCLWLMSGGRGLRRLTRGDKGWGVAEGGSYAVLFDETRVRLFKNTLASASSVERVFLVTDSEEAYAEMVETLATQKPTSMLYRDYLRNFQINTPETQ